MANKCLNSVKIRSDVINRAIIKYSLMAESFLTIEEKECLSQMRETDFLELVYEKGWEAYKIS